MVPRLGASAITVYAYIPKKGKQKISSESFPGKTFGCGGNVRFELPQ